jgi:hypothetical protein
MARLATDDLDLLATRFRLGIPLQGFDGREIPLRHPDGRELDPIEAAESLLASAAGLLPADQGEAFVDATIARAHRMEANAIIGGEPTAVAVARVTGVLVSAAVRASVLAEADLASPTDLNRATLAWYEVHDRRRRRLLAAADEDQRLSA